MLLPGIPAIPRGQKGRVRIVSGAGLWPHGENFSRFRPAWSVRKQAVLSVCKAAIGQKGRSSESRLILSQCAALNVIFLTFAPAACGNRAGGRRGWFFLRGIL